MEKDELGGASPAAAARALLKLSARKSPPAHKTVGFGCKLLIFLRRLLPDRVIEYILQRMYIGRPGTRTR
jgi:hypothetical protein